MLRLTAAVEASFLREYSVVTATDCCRRVKSKNVKSRTLFASGSMTMSDHTTLLDRLGGPSFCKDLVESFCDEMMVEPSLAKFFRYTPMTTMRAHMVKFFKVFLGPGVEYEDLVNHILLTYASIVSKRSISIEYWTVSNRACSPSPLTRN